MVGWCMDNFEIFLIPFLTFHVFLWPHAIAFFCFKSRTRANKRNVNTIQRKLTKNCKKLFEKYLKWSAANRLMEKRLNRIVEIPRITNSSLSDRILDWLLTKFDPRGFSTHLISFSYVQVTGDHLHSCYKSWMWS